MVLFTDQRKYYQSFFYRKNPVNLLFPGANGAKELLEFIIN